MIAILNFNERSGNVYENKGPDQKTPPPCPSLSKEGNRELPSSDEEGVGVVGRRVLCASGRSRAYAFFNERSGNVYENKGQGQEDEGLRSREAEPAIQAVGCRRFVTLRLSTLDCLTRIRRNKARMSMKTNDPAVICIENRTQKEHSFEDESCKLTHKNGESWEVRR